MKKSLRWLSALFAVIMLMSAAMTTVMATDSEEEETEELTRQEYILEQLKNAIPMLDGNWFVPGFGMITGEQYENLYKQYLFGFMYPTQFPNYIYPGIGNYYPFFTASISVDQYSSANLGYGTAYTYYSSDDSIATVNAFGHVYGVSAGEATIICNRGDYTQILVTVTVNEVSAEDANLEIILSVSDNTLYVGQSTTVSAYLSKYSNFPWEGSYAGSAVELTVSDDSVISLSGRTITALKEGEATITASFGELEEQTATIYVTEKTIIVPSYPSYSYPWFDYPNYNYPWFDYDYIYGTYPWWNFTAPSFNNNSAINWEKILGIDTDTYEVERKYSYVNGTWMRTFTLIPKDGTDVTDYDTTVRRVYVTGEWTVVAIRTPVDYVETPKVPEVDSTLTKEEIEALKKAEEAAKKEAALKEKIAKAMEGKLEWYEVYSDLWGDSYYTDAVTYCLEKGYVSGNADYVTFGTADKISWAVLEDVLCVYLGVTEEELTALKLFSYEDSDETITREEIALVIYNVAKHLKLDVSGKASLGGFKDYAELDSEYADAFEWAVKAKVLNKSSEKIDPNGAVDKARICQILYKLDSIKK